MPDLPASHSRAKAKITHSTAEIVRGNSNARGYDSRWRKARVHFLRHHPLCVECQKEGRVTEAKVVDHRTPHKGDRVLFWDRNNWSPMCVAHHNAKTAAQDGGFGNKVK